MKKKIILFIIIVLVVGGLGFLSYYLIIKKNNKTIVDVKTTAVTTTVSSDEINIKLDKNNEYNYSDNEITKVSYILNITDIKLNDKIHTLKYIYSDVKSIYLDSNLVMSYENADDKLTSVKVLNNSLIIIGLTSEGPSGYIIINDQGKKLTTFSGSYSIVDDGTIKTIDILGNVNKTILTSYVKILKDSVQTVSEEKSYVNCDEDGENKYCNF